MFFKTSHSANEIEASVLESLPLPESEDGIQIALQSLADSAEIFEAMNLPEEAEVITQFMETIASGQFAMVKEAKKKAKKKSKTKSKSKTKTKKSPKKIDSPLAIVEILGDGATEGLSSDKEIDNLKNIGWVFNAPKDDCGECNMANDGRDESANDNGFSLDENFDEYFPDLAGPESGMSSKVEMVPEDEEEEYRQNSIDV